MEKTYVSCFVITWEPVTVLHHTVLHGPGISTLNVLVYRSVVLGFVLIGLHVIASRNFATWTFTHAI